MPPVRSQPRNTAFKPPRRISDTANAASTNMSKVTAPRAAVASTSKVSAAARPSTAFKPATTLISSSPDISDIDDDLLSDDEPAKQHRRRSTNVAADTTASATGAAVPPASPDQAGSAAQPPIPPKLLNRLLHEGFQDEDMRIGKEAMAVASKYIETFVREALARAMYEREETDKESGGAGDGFLQVEDLEKLAPQLLLDF